MRCITWKIYLGLRNFFEREEGQDLVEYALILALIALAATVGMQSLANDINSAFTSLGNILKGYVG